MGKNLLHIFAQIDFLRKLRLEKLLKNGAAEKN